MNAEKNLVARLQGVTHRYGKTIAVDSFSLELSAAGWSVSSALTESASPPCSR